MTATVINMFPIIDGKLTKKALLDLPEGTIIVTSIHYSPARPALVHKVGDQASRQASWELIKQHNANGRKFQGFDRLVAYAAYRNRLVEDFRNRHNLNR